MENPFGTLAAGYATARPPVHPRVIEHVAALLNQSPVPLAVDIGCGSGVSTRALDGHALRRIGVEPVEPMLAYARQTAPGAEFVCGRAEKLPLASAIADWITAAGSLNYASPRRFFAEARRVLKLRGSLVIYDFGPGTGLEFGDTALEEWFARFAARYPQPANEALTLDPERVAELAGEAFLVAAAEYFEIGIRFDAASYAGYMLTETNVAEALKRGVPLEEIRSWCEETLAPIWRDAGERMVLFRGYFVILVPNAG